MINGMEEDAARAGANIQTSGNEYRLYVEDARKLNREYYEFFVKQAASGGAYFWTPLLTLNVTCGPGSTVVSEGALVPPYGREQEYDLGSDHGYRFAEFRSSVPACPIESYRIIYTTNASPHASFPAAESVWLTA